MEDIGKNLDWIIREINHELAYVNKDELFARGLSEEEIDCEVRGNLHWNELLANLYSKLSRGDRKLVISKLRENYEKSKKEPKNENVTDAKQHRGKRKREEREMAKRAYKIALRDKTPGKLLEEYRRERIRLEQELEDIEGRYKDIEVPDEDIEVPDEDR